MINLVILLPNKNIHSIHIMQQQLFSTEGNKPKQQSLTISKTGRQRLSKNQEAFNKLTQKIEKLQKDIEKKQLQFDLAMKMYGNELHPAQLRILESRHKLITVLWGIYKSYKLSKTDQRHLKVVLQFHLQEYFSQSETEPDEVLQEIFSAIEGISYDKMMQEEKENEQTRMQGMFDDLDIDIKDTDIDDEAAMAEKMAEAKQKMAEMQERNQEHERQRQAKKKKTAKQTENEKMQKAGEEMKQKNISTIYKQLAKLFHPDLEQDIERKVEKEVLMKELTAAYEAKNLHALLTLELKWIHNETDHLESLTEEKLAIYLQILKEQAMDLAYEKTRVFQQPQYAALVNLFGYSVQNSPVQTIQHHVKSANDITREFENNIADFESEVGLRHVKEMIKQWKNRKEEFNEEEIMKMLFG